MFKLLLVLLIRPISSYSWSIYTMWRPILSHLPDLASGFFIVVPRTQTRAGLYTQMKWENGFLYNSHSTSMMAFERLKKEAKMSCSRHWLYRDSLEKINKLLSHVHEKKKILDIRKKKYLIDYGGIFINWSKYKSLKPMLIDKCYTIISHNRKFKWRFSKYFTFSLIKYWKRIPFHYCNTISFYYLN